MYVNSTMIKPLTVGVIKSLPNHFCGSRNLRVQALEQYRIFTHNSSKDFDRNKKNFF